MTNWHKWAMVLGVASLSGVIEWLLDPDPTIKQGVRHVLLAILPAVLGLKTTLEKDLGIEESPKAKAAGADQ